MFEETYWAPPMEHVLELEERYGITGYEEPIIGLGDGGRIEHAIHELAHGVLLLEEAFRDERHLSVAIPEAIQARIDLSGNPKAGHENEVDTFAVERLVGKQLGLPITDVDYEVALAMQVAGVLEDDFVSRYRGLQETAYIQQVAEEVCKLVAPEGRAGKPSWAEGSPGAVMWRKVRSGDLLIVYPMTFGNGRLCICQDDMHGTMLDAWCYQADKRVSGTTKAILGASEWNGEGDDPPGGWYRNPITGRRRPDGDRTKEFKTW